MCLDAIVSHILDFFESKSVNRSHAKKNVPLAFTLKYVKDISYGDIVLQPENSNIGLESSVSEYEPFIRLDIISLEKDVDILNVFFLMRYKLTDTGDREYTLSLEFHDRKIYLNDKFVLIPDNIKKKYHSTQIQCIAELSNGDWVSSTMETFNNNLGGILRLKYDSLDKKAKQSILKQWFNTKSWSYSEINEQFKGESITSVTSKTTNKPPKV